MKKALLIIVVILFGGCAIQPLGYFTIDPYTKPLDSKISTPINIILLEDVKDSLTVTWEGLSARKGANMVVTKFRKTVQDGLTKTFIKNFSAVNFMEANPKQGLVLLIYRIRPYWKLAGSTTSSNGKTTTTTNYASAVMQYESSLFYNEEKLNSNDGEVMSEGSFMTVNQAQPNFQNCLRVCCESLYKGLITDDVIIKINDK